MAITAININENYGTFGDKLFRCPPHSHSNANNHNLNHHNNSSAMSTSTKSGGKSKSNKHNSFKNLNAKF